MEKPAASCSHCGEHELENFFDLGGNAAEFFDELNGAFFVETSAELAKLEREQEERGELRGEGLGGGDANFGAGVGVDGAVSFARDHGANHVADGDGLRAERDHLALGGESVGSFAGLGNEQAQGVAIGDGVAIAIFAGVVDVNRKAGEAFDHVLAGERRVPTGAAGGDVDAGGAGQFVVVDLHFAEEDVAGVEGDAAERGVADGARLLPDFLEHEVLVAALFRLDRVPLDALEFALDGLAIEVGQLDAVEGEDGHVAVGEEIDVARVVENAGNVGGDEVLAFANADDDGRAGARGDDLVGLGRGENAECEGSGEALDGAADSIFERDRFARFFGFVLDLLDQVGDDLGIGFGDELVALGGELALEFEVVFDDAVVDDDDAAGAVAMGMGVFFGGTAVRGPAGVADAESAVEGMFAQHFFEVAQLAGGAADFEQRGVGSADGDAGRVIAAVFETAQAFNDDWNNFLTADITDDSAHEWILCEIGA